MAKKPTKPDMGNPISPPVSDIAVVACHFNFCGYEAPVRNLAQMQAHMDKLGVTLHIERYEGESILWQKEALLNAAVAKLPAEITKVIIIDADILIPSAEWVQEVSAALDKHPVVQPWKRAKVLGADGQEMRCVSSVAYGHHLKDKRASDHTRYHPGYCWAFQRDFFTEGVGLYENCPVGSGDQLLAQAAIGLKPEITSGFLTYGPDRLFWWKCFSTWMGGNTLGYVDATITALYHGEYANRHYHSRMRLLEDFDPEMDLAEKEAPGPVEWSDYAREHKPGLIRAVGRFFGRRQEDGFKEEPPEPEPEPEPEPSSEVDTEPQVPCATDTTPSCEDS